MSFCDRHSDAGGGTATGVSEAQVSDRYSTMKHIGIAGEAAMAAGICTAMALPRFIGPEYLTGLSKQAGFNIGWFYLFATIACLCAAYQFMLSAAARARLGRLPLQVGMLGRDIFLLVVIGFCIGYTFVFGLNLMQPILIRQYAGLGDAGVFVSFVATLLPLLVFLLIARVWLPRWSAGLIGDVAPAERDETASA